MLLLTLGGCLGLCACASEGSGSGGLSPVEVGGLEARLDAADEEFVLRDYDEALANYQAVFAAARSRRDRALMTEAAAQASATLGILGRQAESDTWFERANEYATESQPRAWSRVLLAEGVRAYRGGDVERARGTFVRLYNYCYIHEDLTPRAIQAAYLVANASRGQERLEWVGYAVNAAESTGNARWEADLWMLHAMSLEEMGRHDEALTSYRKARDIAARALPDRLDKLKADWAYGHGLRLVGRLDEARDLLVESNAIAKSIYSVKPSPRAAEFLGRVIAELGHIDAAEGRKEKARGHFLSAIEKFKEAGAIQNAPGEIRALEQALEDLDKPASTRRIPPRRRG